MKKYIFITLYTIFTAIQGISAQVIDSLMVTNERDTISDNNMIIIESLEIKPQVEVN